MIPYIRETYFIKGMLLLVAMCQSAAVWNLYNGAADVQCTPVNKAMRSMFMHMTFMFGALVVTPFLGIVSTDYAVVFSNYMTWPFILGFIFSFWRFMDVIMDMKNGKKPFEK